MSDLVWQTLAEMPYAFGGPVGQGLVRSTPDDFQVEESLGFEPDGEGEHVLLHLRKRETNTLWLARQIAKLAGVPNRDVSYAGLKDRHAVTSQWFSVRLAGRPEPDWRALDSEQVELLRAERHRRKLRIGALQGNRFRLLIRELSADKTGLEQRLQQIQKMGMPNYFGEQRFGHGYGNLEQASALFERRLGRIDRKLRGLLISAARSQLFNEVLAARIEQGCWNRHLAGEPMKLAGVQSGFSSESLDDEILKCCQEMDVPPSGPLWGRGRPLVSGAALVLEQAVLEPFVKWRNGLEHVGLKQERRSLRISIDDLRWQFPEDTRSLSENREPTAEKPFRPDFPIKIVKYAQYSPLSIEKSDSKWLPLATAPILGQAPSLLLEFGLPAGSYATVLLRELVKVSTDNTDKKRLP